MNQSKLPADFDSSSYLRLNPDVAAARVDPVQHYLTFGVNEGRRYRAVDLWNKVHLMGAFSAALGLSRYLEITTNLTGQRYGETKSLELSLSRRIVYRLNEPVYDGLPVDYKSPDDDISGCLDQIRQSAEEFDLILVDGHHTYDCAIRDLEAAIGVCAPGGVIVVHDCLPPTRAMASPHFVPGPWNGETYRAMIDLCLGNASLDYYTLDIDDGCGIIAKPASLRQVEQNQERALGDTKLLSRWKANATDSVSAFDMFEREGAELLRVGGFSLLREKLSGLKR